MKKLFFFLVVAIYFFVLACEPQKDEIGPLGPAATNGTISIDATDPYNPKFTANADNAFIYKWDLGNDQTTSGKTATSYYPFSGEYNIVCNIAGAGGLGETITTTYTVETTDPKVANKPVWKELTGKGAGRTWVYNTDPETGVPDYCFQTYFDLVTYPEHWKPENSWGQCVRLTPGLNSEMVFDLNGGINYTYHQTPGDEGVVGTFILDAEKMVITIVNPYIPDHNVECTNPLVTVKGIYQIKLLTDDEMVLWQDQEDGMTGWSWSFKSK